jgi:hypothetical protein
MDYQVVMVFLVQRVQREILDQWDLQETLQMVFEECQEIRETKAIEDSLVEKAGMEHPGYLAQKVIRVVHALIVSLEQRERKVKEAMMDYLVHRERGVSLERKDLLGNQETKESQASLG